MVRTYRLLVAIFVVTGLIAIVGPAYAKAQHRHHSGQQQLGNKIKTNGNHVIDKVGKHTVSVNVTNGKVAGVKVKHSEKGDVPVKKYKTTTKMATKETVPADGIIFASYHPTMLVQSQDLGMTYIGYSFIDDNGDEQIYWFPYEMILDGDTGAILYVPLS
jgi:hypothetical protein